MQYFRAVKVICLLEFDVVMLNILSYGNESIVDKNIVDLHN